MLQLKSVDLKKEKITTLIIPVCEDHNIHDDGILSALVKKALEIKEFKGGKDEDITFYNPATVKSDRVIFLGLGKLENIEPEVLRRMAGRAVKKCIAKDLTDIVIAVPAAKKIKLEMQAMLEALLEGGFLGNHIFDKYKKDKKHKPLQKINFMVRPEAAKEFRILPSRVTTVCRGTLLAREWINTPSNHKRPDQFTRSIVTYAKKEGLKVTVFSEKELRQQNFGAILAVGAGSSKKPRMIVLEYSPKRAKKTVALVGKGVTFDSGGINLKSTASLKAMKSDMSGAAIVAAVLLTVAQQKPAFKVIGIIPVVENMPSGNASRPGDIIQSYDGKTIEIGNTDAEGRLILIDAMSYVVKKYKPETLIDVATLTGACVVALGDKIAGVFSFDDKLAEALVSSGEKTSERCWRMPLPEDYKELLKSDLADIHNMSSSSWGGAITAALFLSEFVGNTRWAHIDIAGPAYNEKASAYCGAGGTGFGVRLLCDLLEKL